MANQHKHSVHPGRQVRIRLEASCATIDPCVPALMELLQAKTAVYGPGTARGYQRRDVPIDFFQNDHFGRTGPAHHRVPAG